MPAGFVLLGSAIIAASDDVIETAFNFRALSSGHGNADASPSRRVRQRNNFASQPWSALTGNFKRVEIKLASPFRIEELTPDLTQ